MSSDPNNPDFAKMFEHFATLNQKLMSEFMTGMTAQRPEDLTETYHLFAAGIQQNAQQLLEVQKNFFEGQMALWQNFLRRQQGDDALPVIAPAKGDRRFHAPEWHENPFYDFIKQYYLLSAKWLNDVVDTAHLDEETKKKVSFFTRQYIDAMAPSNFPTTNPEVMKLALETKGESLAQGLKHLLSDMEKGRISMTDESKFEVGGNLAITPGSVIFENELIQLIQYKPTTAKVHERPMVVIPPAINKYYIMDLQPENSLIKYIVDQGHTVYLASWRNVTEELQHKTWDDYLTEGVIKAIEVTQEVSGSEKVNTLGFCIGGALLTSALAVLRAKKVMPAASMTLLTTMLDYTDVGEIEVFVDKAYVEKRVAELSGGGLVYGKELATTFSSLRANDLIWFYVVNNYLKGKVPDAFDILYWNSDSTNLPGPMYAWYLKNFYYDNNLRNPNALTMCGEKVDISRINIPTYALACREDHIVPWKSAYDSASYLKGDVEFVLGASGHIAGVINPASKNKRNYWVGGNQGGEPDQWFETAESREGSWWVHWAAWLKGKAGKQVEAPKKPGNRTYKEIEPAPGRYVKQRVV